MKGIDMHQTTMLVGGSSCSGNAARMSKAMSSSACSRN
jgi:hypothetical protein